MAHREPITEIRHATAARTEGEHSPAVVLSAARG